MNQVKAKFRCTEVRSTEHGDTVTMSPVVSGSKENEQFYKHTPGGQVSLSTVNPALKGFFVPGVEYVLTFDVPVPVPDVANHQHVGSPYDGSKAQAPHAWQRSGDPREPASRDSGQP